MNESKRQGCPEPFWRSRYARRRPSTGLEDPRALLPSPATPASPAPSCAASSWTTWFCVRPPCWFPLHAARARCRLRVASSYVARRSAPASRAAAPPGLRRFPFREGFAESTALGKAAVGRLGAESGSSAAGGPQRGRKRTRPGRGADVAGAGLPQGSAACRAPHRLACPGALAWLHSCVHLGRVFHALNGFGELPV